MQIRNAQVGIAPCHRESLVAEQFRDVAERDTCLPQSRRVAVTQVMPRKIFNSRSTHGWHKPMRVDVQRFTCKIAQDAAYSVPSRSKNL